MGDVRVMPLRAAESSVSSRKKYQVERSDRSDGIIPSRAEAGKRE